MLDEYPRPPVARMLGRGVRRRCPLCGSGDLFLGWVEPRPSCPRCQLKLNRGEGDFFLGAYTLNFVVAELLLGLFLALGLWATWPDVPWDMLLWVGAPLMVLGPVLFYPFSRTIWLALDLAMRPYLVWKVDFTRDKIGAFDTELFKEWFHAFAGNGGLCLHVENLYGTNNHHIAESCFKATARALKAR